MYACVECLCVCMCACVHVCVRVAIMQVCLPTCRPTHIYFFIQSCKNDDSRLRAPWRDFTSHCLSMQKQVASACLRICQVYVSLSSRFSEENTFRALACCGGPARHDINVWINLFFVDTFSKRSYFSYEKILAIDVNFAISVMFCVCACDCELVSMHAWIL